MGLPGDLPEESLPETSPLSPEEVARCRAKNSELNTSLGLEDADSLDPALLEGDEDTVSDSNYAFSDLELKHIAEKNALLDTAMEYFSDDKESAVSEVEVSQTLNDPVTEAFYKSSAMKLDSDDEVSIVIPNDIAAQIKTGGYNIILEPIPGRTENDTVSYSIRSIPTNDTPAPRLPVTNPTESDNSERCDSEEAGGDTSESETDSSRARKVGLGSAHRGGKVKKYDLWMRIGFTTAVRLTGLSVKEACDKFKAPRRRARQWLIEYDRGDNSNLPSLYTQEELKSMYRLKGGRKVKDAVLEEKLVTYYNGLQEEMYPITSELLAYECLCHDENFLGGATSPHFTKRIADFLRHWRKRNFKRLRKPTSTGQKLPDGYTGKWEACSYYMLTSVRKMCRAEHLARRKIT